MRFAGQIIRARQGAGQRMRLFEHVMKRAAIEIFRCRQRRVIEPRAADKGDIEGRIAAAIQRCGQVGIVGQNRIDVGGKRRRRGIGHCVCIDPRDLRIAGRGLEHARHPAPAPRFEIDDRADPVGQRMAGEELPRSDEAEFLGIGQDHDDIALRRALGGDRPHRFEDRGDARGIVGRARRAPYAVVMRHQRNCRQRWIGSGEQTDHIDEFGRLLAVLAAPVIELVLPAFVEPPAHGLDRQPDRLEFADEIAPYLRIGGAARHVRFARDLLDMGEGALRRWLRRIAALARRRRRRRREDGKHNCGEQRRRQPPDLFHRPFSPCVDRRRKMRFASMRA